MKSSELANAVAQTVTEAQLRIMGVGAEQYAQGDTQKFEGMPIVDLVEYVREETLDLINYGVMLTIRLDRLKSAYEHIQTQVDGLPIEIENAYLNGFLDYLRDVGADFHRPTIIPGFREWRESRS